MYIARAVAAAAYAARAPRVAASVIHCVPAAVRVAGGDAAPALARGAAHFSSAVYGTSALFRARGASGSVPVLPLTRPQSSTAGAAGPQEPISTEPLPEGSPADASKPAPGGEEPVVDAHAAALKALEGEVVKLKASLAESNSARLRLLAEMENVRVIARRDVDTAKVFSIQSFAKRLIDSVDNLNAAVASVPPEYRSKETAAAAGGEKAGDTLVLLYNGVSATERSLVKTLAEFGIQKFGAVGDKFDPNRYEAMLQMPATEEVPEGTVASVLKTGYSFKERTLRPAQVAVATKPPA